MSSRIGRWNGPLWDANCGEPVQWWEDGKWVGLTAEMAIKKYGPVTAKERGPQGGHRSTTYGTKRFLSQLEGWRNV